VTERRDDEDSNWHLDKRIPIVTLIAILGQAVALGWMASSMDGRIAQLEAYTEELRVSRIRERMAVEEAATVVTSQRFVQLDNQLDRLEDKVDKIAEKIGAK
jgi:hypothetical protein|tara:strand:- start:16 stop:321 length:306 start_codon:yes stop_codon:yes gene_type:complete